MRATPENLKKSVLLSAFCALKPTNEYIVDVYKRTTRSPKSPHPFTLPEVATGPAVHINLTGVTGF